MQKIVPHLWFDKEAKEAAEFYASAQPNSGIKSVRTLHNTPSGDVDVVSFILAGQDFMAISAGPLFKFTPAVSFLVACRTHDEVNSLWARFSEGGKTLMPLAAYPFSERYGWTEDRYGLSWQIMHAAGAEVRQRITPTLMFTGKACGKAEEAIGLYTTVFKNSGVAHIQRYGEGEAPDKPGTIRHAAFSLEDQSFAAMDSARTHTFSFNEAISFIVNCETQEDIDYYWDRLSAVPAAEQCGWIKDAYGLSWQIVPTAMDAMMRNGSEEQIARLTAAFLKMKKFDIAKLRAAYGRR